MSEPRVGLTSLTIRGTLSDIEGKMPRVHGVKLSASERKLIRSAIIASGESQRYWAKRLGISPQVFCQYLTGGKFPPEDTLRRLALWLGLGFEPSGPRARVYEKQ